MENTDLLKNQLEIDNIGINHLLETAKWGKLMAIVGFVFTAIIIISGLIFSIAMGSVGGYYGNALAGLGPVISLMYIIFGALPFFPCLLLYRFSTKMKMAITTNDQEMLNEALNQHRRMYKFLGILILIVICLYGFIILLGGLGAAFS